MMKTQTDYMKNMKLRYDARFRGFCEQRKCINCEFYYKDRCVCVRQIVEIKFNDLIKYLEVFENEQKGPLKF